MSSTRNIPTSIAGRLAVSAGSAVAVLTAVLAGGSGAALAAGAHFVPEATEAGWDGTVATVTFREVGLPPDGGVTTISAKVTAAVDAVCRRGESILRIHRSASALDVQDYPIDSDDGVAAGTARVPLEVTGLKVTGWTCVTQRVALTAELEDFWTGATLIHRT